MTDETTPEQTQESTPQATPLLYANVTAVRSGPFDVALDFGYLAVSVEGHAPNETQTQWGTRVAMSWEHARALHELLGEQIAKYEENVGPLPDIARLKTEEAR
jgi:hypothetical protein